MFKKRKTNRGNIFSIKTKKVGFNPTFFIKLFLLIDLYKYLQLPYLNDQLNQYVGELHQDRIYRNQIV